MCMSVLMYVATIQRLNYSGPESWKKKQFMIQTHLWPWNKIKIIKPGVTRLTRKQNYSHAKFEKPHFNSVCEKAIVRVFVKPGNMSVSFKNMHESKK